MTDPRPPRSIPPAAFRGQVDLSDWELETWHKILDLHREAIAEMLQHALESSQEDRGIRLTMRSDGTAPHHGAGSPLDLVLELSLLRADDDDEIPCFLFPFADVLTSAIWPVPFHPDDTSAFDMLDEEDLPRVQRIRDALRATADQIDHSLTAATQHLTKEA